MSARAASPEEIRRLVGRFAWGVRSSGALPGRGWGRRLGSAGEFEGYRPYEPGDDLRSLDLRVFQRLGRRMTRVSREDSATPLTLLVDRSGSMAGKDRERVVHELTLFFLLLAHRNGDPARLLLFRGGELEGEPTAGADLPLRLDEVLRSAPPAGDTGYRRAFMAIPPDPAGSGLIVVLSDAFGIRDPDRELAPLARRGRPFWLAPLEEPERDPLPAGAVELISREGEPPWRGRIAEHTRRLYRDKLARRHEALQARLVGWGGDFLALPAEEGISGLIGRIQARGRLLR